MTYFINNKGSRFSSSRKFQPSIIENVFTPIPNETMEVLAKTKFNNYEARYILFLWRKTFGWHKDSDRISNSQFVKGTNIRKQHIWRTEQQLLRRHIITKVDDKIAFNVSYEQWDRLPNEVTVTESDTKVTQLGTEVTQPGTEVTQLGGYKRNDTKEIKQKKENFSFNDPLTDKRTPEEQKSVRETIDKIRKGLNGKFKMPEWTQDNKK